MAFRELGTLPLNSCVASGKFHQEGFWAHLLCSSRIRSHACLLSCCEDSVGHVCGLQSSALYSCGLHSFPDAERWALVVLRPVSGLHVAAYCRGPHNVLSHGVLSLHSPCGPALGEIATCPQGRSPNGTALGQDQTLHSHQWRLSGVLQQLGLRTLSEVLLPAQL